LVVTKCPICNEFLVGYTWTKTKTNKNWLNHKEKGWHNCPNKKFKKKTAGKNKKLFGYPEVTSYMYDSDKPGYYCTGGHYQGQYKEMKGVLACIKCGVSLTVLELKA